MQFVINDVKYWIMLGPSGLTLYKKEGSKSKYLGRKSITEVKEMLAKADAETLQQIKSDIETIKLALDSRKTAAQTAQTAQPSLTWKKDSHTYWILQYGTSFYIYMKGPSTKHRPKLVEKTDISGAIDRLVAAGAAHVLEALRALVNGLHAAVSDLLKPHAEAREESKKPPSKPQAESTLDGAQRARREAPQVSRREAEEALRELKSALRRAAERWGEEWRLKTRGGLEEPDVAWLKEKLMDFINAHVYLLEKIQPYEDLLDKFADAVVEAAAGRLTRSDALEILK